MGNLPIIENVREIPIILDRWQAPEGYEVLTFGQYKKHHPKGTEEGYYHWLQEQIFKDEQVRHEYGQPPDIPNRLVGLLTLSRDLQRNVIPTGFKNLTVMGLLHQESLKRYKQQKQEMNATMKRYRKREKAKRSAQLHEHHPSPMAMKLHKKYGLGMKITKRR